MTFRRVDPSKKEKDLKKKKKEEERKPPESPLELLLTTEMLRVRRLAYSVTSQVMLLPLHSASVELMPSVSVASFTFCRPFAQAEEHTSHRKTRIAVIKKSCKPAGPHQLFGETLHLKSSQSGFISWKAHQRRWLLTKMGPKSESL